MATIKYELTFAQVPFVTDVARVIRMAGNLASEQEDDSQLPPRKQQPLADLVDEINRILDDRYTFQYELDGITRQTSSLAQWNQPKPNPRIGDYYYPTGASRWSVFMGLATGPQVAAMEKATEGGIAATFQMQQVPIGPNADSTASYTISTQLRMLPPRPISEHAGGLDGLFLVTLVDERYFWNSPVTINPNDVTTWSSVLSTLATALGVTFDFGTIDPIYGQPEPDSQLWVSQESAATLLDAVAFNIGRVVVRKFDGTYVLRSPTDAASTVTTNLTDLQARTAGGNLFCSGISSLTNLTNARNIVPAAYAVTFPKYVLEPIPHYFNTRYSLGNLRPSAWWEDSYGEVNTITVPITSGGMFASGLSGYSTNVLHDTARAVYDTEVNASLSGAAINASGLQALAMQMAKDQYDWKLAYALDVVFPGIVLWQPDGLHDIVWRYSERTRQATTRVLKTAWNAFPSQFQHAIGITGSGTTTFVSGVGGHSVPLTVLGGGLSGGVVGPYSGISFGTNVIDFFGAGVTVSGETVSGGLQIAHVNITGTGGGTTSGINSGFIGSYSSGIVTSGVYVATTIQQVQIARYFVSGGVVWPSIASGTPGREVEVMNVSPQPSPGDAPSTITYLNESTLDASPGNRISTPDGQPVVQQPQETVKLKYTDSRWKFAERIPGPPYTITGGGGSPAYLALPSGTFQGVSGVYVDYTTSPYQISRSGCMPASVYICSGTVIWSNLGSGAVTSGSIASGSIYWPHLASGIMVAQSGVLLDYTVGPPTVGYGMVSGQVVSGLIGNGAVNSGNLGSGQIAWTHLSSGAVRSGHVADVAVNSGNVASGQLTWPHLSSGYIVGQSGVVVSFATGPPTIGINIVTSSGAAGVVGDIGCSVTGAYFSGGGASFSGNGNTPIVWSGAANWDTDNIYNSSSGTLTIQTSGKYICNYNLWPAFLSGQIGDVTTRLIVNGTQINTRGAGRVVNFVSGSAGVANLVAQGTGLTRLVSGDTITVQFDSNGMSGVGINGLVSYLTVQKLA